MIIEVNLLLFFIRLFDLLTKFYNKLFLSNMLKLVNIINIFMKGS